MEDFWSLIEEQHVTSVVMVTSPESPSYKVHSVSTHVAKKFAYYIVHRIKLGIKHYKQQIKLNVHAWHECCSLCWFVVYAYTHKIMTKFHIVGLPISRM